ncbi:MAG: 4Fe-4S binding protein [Myxococcales bacterium]|nr:4Fe-4S binding protein [Myxococcales bacterium]
MRHFLDALKSVATIAKSFGRKTDTVQYPKVVRPRAERYRASFALLHEADGDEACIGCLQCERICPSKVIAIKGPAKRDSPITGKKRSYADDFTLDLSACIFCELCVQVCPTDAIVMTREQEPPAYGRESLVLTMARLYENEKTKTRAWGDGTKLMEMQTPPKPPKPAPVAGAPVAAPVAGAPAPAAAPVATPAAAPTAAAPATAPVAAAPVAAAPTAAPTAAAPVVTAPVGAASPIAPAPAAVTAPAPTSEPNVAPAPIIPKPEGGTP